MLNENEVIARKYRIVRHLNRGMFANAYEAMTVRDSRRVFLKEYISPRPSKPWYKPFVSHQRALTKALSESGASQFCLLPEDTFEASDRVTAAGETRKTPPTLYQTFEFIEGGIDLEKRLSKKMPWEDRRMFASVLAFGLRELHVAGVVHTDLKPANLQIIEKTGPAGRTIRTPRLIDMDFSILSNSPAPWHGHSGYVGTPGYMSPEHLAGADGVPLAASDVFTAGLILHELLGSGNPLGGLDDSEYLKRIRSGRIDQIKLAGTFGRAQHDARVIEVIAACLSFDHRNRPTASQLHQAIVGAEESPAPADPPEPPKRSRAPEPPRSKEPPSPPPPAPVESMGIRLVSGAVRMEIRVTTVVGRTMLQKLGDDSRYAATEQYRLVREGGSWFIEHVAPKGNQTIVNGRQVTTRVALVPGDRISIGNAERGIEKLTLQVERLA